MFETGDKKKNVWAAVCFLAPKNCGGARIFTFHANGKLK